MAITSSTSMTTIMELSKLKLQPIATTVQRKYLYTYIYRDHPESMTPETRCLHARDGKHYVEIPRCKFGSMYDWLVKIEQRNRLKIRHIQIRLSGCQFAKVLGEWYGGDDPFKSASRRSIRSLSNKGVTSCFRTIQIDMAGPSAFE